ncbi:MAG: hypothetical protein M3209_00310 [Acidobacteriota bacterium]|nr:hypothetical protein [Acidobacteriota bacterium]
MTKATSTFTEFGVTGLPIYAGRVFDEPLRSLTADKWRRAVREMTSNDAVISSMLFAIEMLARQVTWNFEPADESNDAHKEAEFFRQCLFEDQTHTWQETNSEILSFLPWGWSYLEECYKRRSGESRDKTKNSRYSDGRIGWRKWAIRAQESLDSWDFDEFGEVTAMVQYAPPDYKLLTVPIEKALHFRTSAHKGNPEGRSILRGCYRSWYFKSNIENIEGVGIERDLAGLPVMYAPEDWFRSTATAEQLRAKNEMMQTLASIRRAENEGVMLPSTRDAKSGHLLFELKLLTSGGSRQFDTNATIGQKDQRIAMTVMADFLLMGSQQVGSYALSNNKKELFTTALGAWLDTVCETVNRHAVPRLGKLNNIPQALLPKLVHGPVERISLKEFGEYVKTLSGANIQFDEEEQAVLKRKIIPASKTKKAAAASSGKTARKQKPADEKKSQDKNSDEKDNENNKSDE